MSMRKEKQCDMCLMPFPQDIGVRDTENYCSLCHHDGKFSYEGTDVKEFQRVVKQKMIERGIPKWKAAFFAWTIRFAPHWKRVKG